MVARHDYPVLMPEVDLVTRILLLVDQDWFLTLLQVFVDIPKIPQVLDLLESIQRSYHGYVQVTVYLHRAERLLG